MFICMYIHTQKKIYVKLRIPILITSVIILRYVQWRTIFPTKLITFQLRIHKATWIPKCWYSPAWITYAVCGMFIYGSNGTFYSEKKKSLIWKYVNISVITSVHSLFNFCCSSSEKENWKVPHQTSSLFCHFLIFQKQNPYQWQHLERSAIGH